MDYVGRAPAPPLDRYIDDIYCLSGTPRHRRLTVPPMPSAHLMINLAAPARLYDSDPAVLPAMLTDAWFMGVWTRRFVIEHPTPTWIIGVHFKPWGLSALLDVPSGELTDRWLPLDAVWGSSATGLRERIGAAASTGEMLLVVERELRSRLVPRPSRGFDLVDHAARQLAARWGAVTIDTLTHSVNVSGTHLATQFTSHVGVTPKRVARIYRFARLILSVDATHPVEWTRLAVAAGYYDQAHFSKEFKEFTGHTPTAYLALRRRHPADKEFPPDAGPMPAE